MLDIKLNLNSNDALTAAVSKAYHDADQAKSKLIDEYLTMPGMSGKKYRHFVNNLVGNLDDCRYLEIGTHAGSTTCAAVYGNLCTVTCIDNWSQFNGPKKVFENNMARLLENNQTDLTFLESDFRAVEWQTVGKHNLYLFDGPHEYQDQYDGIVMPQAALTDDYIQIVDDWNYAHVREATHQATSDLNLKVVSSIEIRTHEIEAEIGCEQSDWHNGYYIAVMKRI
jgi:Methyltransferase domain